MGTALDAHALVTASRPESDTLASGTSEDALGLHLQPCTARLLPKSKYVPGCLALDSLTTPCSQCFAALTSSCHSWQGGRGSGREPVPTLVRLSSQVRGCLRTPPTCPVMSLCKAVDMVMARSPGAWPPSSIPSGPPAQPLPRTRASVSIPGLRRKTCSPASLIHSEATHLYPPGCPVLDQAPPSLLQAP